MRLRVSIAPGAEPAEVTVAARCALAWIQAERLLVATALGYEPAVAMMRWLSERPDERTR